MVNLLVQRRGQHAGTEFGADRFGHLLGDAGGKRRGVLGGDGSGEAGRAIPGLAAWAGGRGLGDDRLRVGGICLHYGGDASVVPLVDLTPENVEQRCRQAIVDGEGDVLAIPRMTSVLET